MTESNQVDDTKSDILDSVAVFGPGSAIMPGMVILIAIGLIVLANKAGSNKWLS